MSTDLSTKITQNVLADAYNGIERAKTDEDLRSEMERFAKQVGFDHWAYVLTIKSPSLKYQEFIINGFPSTWMQRYVARDYFTVDPVIRYAENNTLPAIWKSTEQPADERTAEFWEEASHHGLRTGLTFAVHDRPGITGIVSFARNNEAPDPSGEDLAALIGRTQMFSVLLHEGAARIAMPKLIPEQEALLTSREIECLKWAAEGKTAWEIGKILSISERTAVFHLGNSIRKLGATNKTQAIVRAIVLKLI